MISLEQIRQLQTKVDKAVQRMAELQEENEFLHEELASYETRIKELEQTIESFRSEQQDIEAGIVAALAHLDSLEQAVGGLHPTEEAGSAGATQTVSPVANREPEASPEPTPPKPAVQSVEFDTAAVEPASSESIDEAGEEESEEPNRQLDIF